MDEHEHEHDAATKRSRFLEAFQGIVETRFAAPPPPLPPPPTTTTTSTATPLTAGAPPNIPKNRSLILASEKQRNNPVLRHVRHAAVEFAPAASLTSDFELSDTTTALFLSVQYAKLHPQYLWTRIEGLRRCRLRVLLVLVDDPDCERTLLSVQALAVSNGLTVLLAFSQEEAARYLETYAVMKNKSDESLKGKRETDALAVVTDALTEIKTVNKTDVKTLLRNFDGTLMGVFSAKMEEMALCEGVGGKKVLQLHKAFNEPFFREASSSASKPAVATTSTTTPTTTTPTAAAAPPPDLPEPLDQLDDEELLKDDDDDEQVGDVLEAVDVDDDDGDGEGGGGGGGAASDD